MIHPYYYKKLKKYLFESFNNGITRFIRFSSCGSGSIFTSFVTLGRFQCGRPYFKAIARLSTSMIETVYVGDKFEMSVTDSRYWWPSFYNTVTLNISKNTILCHQHHKIVTIKVTKISLSQVLKLFEIPGFNFIRFSLGFRALWLCFFCTFIRIH